MSERKDLIFDPRDEHIILQYVGAGGDVEIPAGVEGIGSRAFENCTALTRVVLPDGMDGIGCWAFRGCENLTDIYIPHSVKFIDSAAFSGVPYVVIHTPAGSYAEECAELMRIPVENDSTDVPQNGCIVKEGVLRDCLHGGHVEVPNGTNVIGKYAFGRCYGLKSIQIPASVRSIEHSAFEPLETPGDIAFAESALQEVRFAKGSCLAEVGDRAFIKCPHLAEVVFPPSLQRLGATHLPTTRGCAGSALVPTAALLRSARRPLSGAPPWRRWTCPLRSPRSETEPLRVARV